MLPQFRGMIPPFTLKSQKALPSADSRSPPCETLRAALYARVVKVLSDMRWEDGRSPSSPAFCVKLSAGSEHQNRPMHLTM